MLNDLKNQVKSLGKPAWRPLLEHIAELHADNIHPPFYHLQYPWEEVSLASNAGRLFGNWDSVHMALDVLPIEPQHAKHTVLNYISLQQEDGFIPGSISLLNNHFHWNRQTTCPPLWPYVVQEYLDSLKGKRDPYFLRFCYEVLRKQLHWFEQQRKSGNGFYYIDRLDRQWESGVEESVRYDQSGDIEEEMPFVDATAHVYSLCCHAVNWATELSYSDDGLTKKIEKLRHYIQESMFDEETGFFHDVWSVNNKEKRVISFEGIWPLVAGAATHDQAQRVINDNLLDPSRFFTSHPIPSVGLCDPRFEYFHWRGPTRNSMTYWAVRGCLKYDRRDAAKSLLERALDSTAAMFNQTGNVWEFYHPQGGDPRELSRCAKAISSVPQTNYLGHNPLIAMAHLWEKVNKG